MGLIDDVRTGARFLLKNPGFATTAVLLLAIGIGANVTVFTVANAVLFRGFAQVDNEEILYIDTRTNGRGCCVSYPDFLDWRERARSFEDMGAVADLRVTFTDGSSIPESYSATEVTSNTFRLLGQQPVIGRDFTPEDEAPGAGRVAILTFRFWEQRFGKRADIIGATVRVNGVPSTIVGVMPEGFSFPKDQQLWVPLVPTERLSHREARGLWFAFGRLTPNANREIARAEMEIIGRQLAAAYPNTNEALLPQLHGFAEFFISPNAKTVYGSLWLAVGLVLLIACANVANLMIARSAARTREMSVRIALGAGHWRIARQLLAESFVLATFAGILGWLVGMWGVRGYEAIARPPAWFANVIDYGFDYRVLGYAMLLSAATAVAFGLAPARSLRKLDVNAAIKEGGRSATAGRQSRRISGVLVSAQMAVAVIVLAGAGLMLRSLINISKAETGVQADSVLTLLLNLPESRYRDAQSQARFYEELTSRLQRIPGVESVAFANRPPAAGSLSVPFEIAREAPEARRPTVSTVVISPGYFQTLGARLTSGREFATTDGVSGTPVVIVNELFANQHWRGESAVGKRLRLFDAGSEGTWVTVVGVASNIVQNDSSRQRIDPVVYLPYREKQMRSMWLFAKTHVAPETVATTVRREIGAIDPELPIWLGPFTLDERLKQGYSLTTSISVLFVLFAAIALLLSAVGVYAVAAHGVTQRVQEIRIRMAIGATSSDIMKLVLMQALPALGIGLVIGMAGALATNRMLRSLVVDVSPSDPLTLSAVFVILLACGLLGCMIPALRAVRLDAAGTLKN